MKIANFAGSQTEAEEKMKSAAQLLNEEYVRSRAKGLKARAFGLVKKTYTIEASPEVIARLDKFLAYVERCAGIGHSTIVGMSIDGDGPESLYVKSPKLAKMKDIQDSADHRIELVG